MKQLTTHSIKVLMVCGVFALLSCDAPQRVTADALFLVTSSELGSYNLKEPSEKYFLPYVLEEISGLDYVKDGLLACVQDEDGKLFLYNYKERKIVKSIKFWKQGDYEGVEVVGDTAFVVKSNGSIFKFNYMDEDPQSSIQEIETPLSRSNDIEGLVYDAGQNRLLLACKGKSDLKNKRIKGKAIFAYDLSEGSFIKKPVFTITKSQIKDFLEKHKDNTYEERRINFNPSGIALHPIENKFYVLASTGKLLVVTDKAGNIEASYPIAPRILGQPEGICFAPNGDLFISSEGEGDKGYILRFDMQ